MSPRSKAGSSKARSQRDSRPAEAEGAAAAPTRREPTARTERSRAQATWAHRLIRNTVLWLIPVAALWVVLTPSYNRFLEVGGQNLLRIAESPDVTRLDPRDEHYALIARTDLPHDREVVGSLRVTDLHFPIILLAALFLAVPGVPWKERLANLGWALLASAFLHLFLVVAWVEFTYTTQLGPWSLAHYGPVARNGWGLAKHLLDLPIKLAWPFALWAGFYLRKMLPAED